MNGQIKKLGNFPVTIDTGVFIDGTNINLHDFIKKYLADYSKYADVLKAFKGVFDTSKIVESRASSIGNFWYYNGTDRLNLDGRAVEPHSFIYVTQTNVNSNKVNCLRYIHIPYQTRGIKQNRYDVVIVGGGAGGIGAAYALKDSGLKVALVERLDTLGGTHCNAGVGLLLASPVGNWYKNICKQAYEAGKLDFDQFSSKYREVGTSSETAFDRRWRATQFIDEATTAINNFTGSHVQINDVWFSNKYYDDLKSKIDIFLNWEVYNVKADKASSTAKAEIYELECRNLYTKETMTIVGDYFIDASADAVLATKNSDLISGTDYYSGSDGNTRFSETAYSSSATPDPYDINTVEATWFSVTNPFKNSTVHEDLQSDVMKTFSNQTNKTNFNYSPVGGGTGIGMCSRSYSIGMLGKNYITRPYEWNYADGEARAQYYNRAYYNNDSTLRQYTYGGICKMLAVRESWRYNCDYMLKQSDMATQITTSNLATKKIMALSSWYADIHNSSITITSTVCTGIPYESMIPTAYKNVLVASRCYGASHIALSNLRLVKTMLDLGYSAGKAMIDCWNTHTDVRDASISNIQTATGIADTMSDVQSYFYGSTVSYTDVDA